MSKIVFTTFGSWGDLFPMIRVAIELRTRGHEVVFATSPAAADVVEGEGFELRPVGPHLGFEEYARHPEILDSRARGLVGLMHLARRFILPHLEQSFVDLRAACSDADLLVSHPVQLAGPPVAQALGLRWATATVFPSLLPSAYLTPQFLGHRTLPRAVNRTAWAVIRAALRGMFDPAVNRLRRSQGLPEVRDALVGSGTSPLLSVLLTSPHYTPRPPDWPAQVSLTGFTPWDRPSSWAEPADLRAFLDDGSPPIVCTIGASLSIDPQRFFHLADEALQLLGRRGVFLVADAAVQPARASVVYPYVPLSMLLPRTAGVVHHGGFGTTCASLLAGLPQVVVPRAFDQFHHADRVEALGIGRRLPWRRLDTSRLTRELRLVLGEPRFSSSAKQLARELREEDGPARASEQLEALLAD